MRGLFAALAAEAVASVVVSQARSAAERLRRAGGGVRGACAGEKGCSRQLRGRLRFRGPLLQIRAVMHSGHDLGVGSKDDASA